MQKIDGAGPLKHQRTEEGTRHSSLSNLEGDELWQKVSSLSYATLDQERIQDLILIVAKITTIAASKPTDELNEMVLKITELASVHPKLKNAHSHFISKLPSQGQLDQRINNLVNKLFLRGNEMASVLAQYGRGVNFLELKKAIDSKDETYFRFLIQRLDFSFVNENLTPILIEAYKNLSPESVTLLIGKINPNNNAIIQIMSDKNLKYFQSFALVNLIHSVIPFNNAQIQHFFDLALSFQSHNWMGFWAKFGGKIQEKGADYITLLQPYIPEDNSSKSLYDLQLVDDKGVLQIYTPDNFYLNGHVPSEFSRMKSLNPSLFYFFLSKKVNLVWGINSVIKNPFGPQDYKTGSRCEYTRHYWIQALQYSPMQEAWMPKVINNLNNIIDLDASDLIACMAQYAVLGDQPQIIRSGHEGHIKFIINTPLELVDCNRGEANENNPGANFYHNEMTFEMFMDVVSSKRMPLNTAFTSGKMVQKYHLNQSRPALKMRDQFRRDNCTITSMDAAVLALIELYNPQYSRQESYEKYKYLTGLMRYFAAIDLFNEINMYLRTPRSLDLDQYFYTILSGMYLKFKENPMKLRTPEVSAAVFNNIKFLMNVFESRFSST